MSNEDRQLTLLGYLGTRLYNYCQGYLGDCNYDGKEIVGIGSRWIAVIDNYLNHEYKLLDTFRIAVFENSEELVRFIQKNKKEA